MLYGITLDLGESSPTFTCVEILASELSERRLRLGPCDLARDKELQRMRLSGWMDTQTSP